MATLADIAKAAKVSKAAVSYAFSNDSVKQAKLSAATLEHILNTAKQLDYVPSWTARALAHQKSYNIALLLPENCTTNISGHYLGLFHGVSSAISESEYNLSVFFGCNEKFLQSVLHNRVDGIVVIASLNESDAFSVFSNLNKPVVFLNRIAPSICPKASSCRSDYAGWANEVISDFLDKKLSSCQLFYRPERNGDQEVLTLLANLCQMNNLKFTSFNRDEFTNLNNIDEKTGLIFCGSSPKIIDALSKSSSLNYVVLTSPEVFRLGNWDVKKLYFHNSEDIGYNGVKILLDMIDKNSKAINKTIPLIKKQLVSLESKTKFEF